ncbi:hypothetical protein MHPYR_510006 [uncultured Mycobacterium sp.]|uniref:Uncharacterized protein n=1 Tax=uncultured Mycobacterium sp. TaxID=171292 RepID=A0A1Y5PHI2_9MYCO|nr:hypothetical protein MHPYR_510006 [uncultured Mycobacterium sp.]
MSAILAEISAKHRELGSGPADPAALTAFQRFVDQICLGRREGAMLGCWIEGETQAFAATARPHGGSAGSPA